MSKEEDSKFLKIQTCVMKVNNICCDGCQKKVKKVLHKIDGVYTSAIDVEGRKVTVTGNVDPAILIKKLNKAGKHAELLSAKGGKEQNVTNKLEKLHLELAKEQHKSDGKAQKGGGGGGGKEQKGQQPQQLTKGFKDLKFPSFEDFKIPFKKDTKTGKSDLPSKELEGDDGSEFDDEYDEHDEFDDDEAFDEMDGSDEDFCDDPKMVKAMNLQPKSNGVAKDKKGGGGGGGGGGKGGEAPLLNKIMEGKKGGGGNKDQGSGGGKNGHGGHDSKNGGNNSKGGHGNAHNGNPSHGGNKGGGSNDGVVGGLPMGQPNMMGQLGNMNPSMGLGGPPPGYFQGGSEMMAGANPYQQQYLQALMQHQQQQRVMMNGHDRPAFPPMMGYGYGQPTAHMPPPPGPGPGPYTIFSDENPNSCSIM
ncbi:neurogenic protein mastermind-like [Canna indica]|uniref:Neurogenic protein mastermind-like n=1 Tax=Canna indica TaxID=4628 RepID=A0AAQ3QLY3_9LILI|nr:neurogenic protein mastermind-like [Canna indica]